MYLMASPAARGLFAKAIAESAYMITTPELREKRFGVDSAEAAGEALAKKLGAADVAALRAMDAETRSEEHTSELQSLMRISYAVFCLKKKTQNKRQRQKATGN